MPYYQSPIGLIHITGTAEYISAMQFVPEEESIGEDLITNSLILDCIRQLHEYFSGSRKQFDLPVKQEGTVFQQTVWKLLQEIPFGETVSYLELAKRFGDEKAVRAVGSANGKNKIPIIVPCHRVIGSDGKLVGFAYGIERKKFLLNHEQQFQQTALGF